MKTMPSRLQSSLRRVALPALFCVATAVPLSAQLNLPVITSVRQVETNVVVKVGVPPGLQRVTLECRDRLGARSWEPRAVTRVDGAGGTATFRVPRSRPFEVMRVRGDATEPLPASFYAGTNSFLGQPGSADGTTWYRNDALAETPTAGTGGASREVVESDIWKIRGSTLYFFNQYRGLQVLDISRPDAATVRGTLELAASGEQMYLIETNYAVLLARGGCYSGDSEVLIVSVTNSPLAVAARLPVPGYVVESRMVGTALYVASQAYRPVAGTTNTTWEWGTLVSSFDLATPETPVARSTLWYSGYGHVVAATDVYLFVVTQSPANWWQSAIRIIDITDPAGAMNPYGTITPAGQVPDKFKLNYANAVLTTISEDWHLNSGARLVTKLETWRLPDPRSAGPVGIGKLGTLELGAGERLRATRFDGDRVYVVTFFQIDPLFVVDLADPAQPRIAGSVDVPGWSTYIEPLGDRLVTMGVESNRVAVSLFDVGNPAAPALLSRALLGQTWSWSEANYNEKAFTVLPAANLILVPFNGDITNRYTAVLQLIDLHRNSLVARGQITSSFQFRRATALDDRVISISGWEYLSVDTSDREHPIVSGRTELAWPVDRVFLAGDYLVEMGAGNGWDSASSPTLRVVRAAAPGEVLARRDLVSLPVLGAAVRDGKLYVAQGTLGGYSPVWLADPLASPALSNAAAVMLTVVSLAELPALPVLGQVAAPTQPLGWGGDWQAVWPNADTLVWVGGQNSWGWCDFCPVPMLDRAVAPGMIWRPYRGGGGGHLIAFDVADAAAPQLASEIDLNSTNWWTFSKAFAADGLVYLSHQASEFVVGLRSPWQAAVINQTVAADGQVVTNLSPVGTWVQSAYLDVVDYADPRDPLVRKPVSLPGTLTGIAQGGALLYTVGSHWTTNTATVWNEYLDASAYDGVSAHLIDSLALPTTWPHPVLAVGANVFVGWPADTLETNKCALPTVQTWALSTAGRWQRLGCVSTPSAPSTFGSFPGLLAVQENDNAVQLFDLTDPANLRTAGYTKPGGCWWFDLTHADGDLGHGVWIPLGAYGVATIPVKP